MEHFSHFILGIIVTFVGLSSPGKLNMSVTYARLNRGAKRAAVYSFGAILGCFIQAVVGVVLAKYLSENKEMIQLVEQLLKYLFFVLAIFFLIKARSKFKFKRKRGMGSYAVRGFVMSFKNIVITPFFILITLYLGTKGFLLMTYEYLLMFVIGTIIGAYLLFMVYNSMAKVIKRRVAFLSQYNSYVLSVLFFVFGIIALI